MIPTRPTLLICGAMTELASDTPMLAFALPSGLNSAGRTAFASGYPRALQERFW